MKKFLKWSLITIVSFIVLILTVSFFLSNKYTLESSIKIKSNPELVFSTITNFHSWKQWNPWMIVDSSMKSNFITDSNIVNSRWEWESSILGKGKVLITEINEPNLIKSDMIFETPEKGIVKEKWEINNFSLDSVKVTWQHIGDLDYPIGRILGLWAESMLKPSFDEGLINLKTFIESSSDSIKTK